MECYEALWVKIQHNGLGVSKEEQQFIFEPFFTNQSVITLTQQNAYLFHILLLQNNTKVSWQSLLI